MTQKMDATATKMLKSSDMMPELPADKLHLLKSEPNDGEVVYIQIDGVCYFKNGTLKK